MSKIMTIRKTYGENKCVNGPNAYGPNLQVHIQLMCESKRLKSDGGKKISNAPRTSPLVPPAFNQAC